YAVEGIIYGMIAGIISIAIAGPVIYFVSPYIKIFIPEINIWSYFGSHFFALLGYQLLFGIGLGIISSSIAISKYLKV
ncbi:MAG: hypothetical protein AAB616_01265, partial [Patescibacteria group bacterium]